MTLIRSETGARRILPQPIDITIKNNRHPNPAGPIDGPIRRDSVALKPRKFTPQLIESSRRRRKSTDTCPAVLQTDKTEAFPGDQSHEPRHVDRDRIARQSESRFSSTILKKKESRQHSYRAPSLPVIESSGSDGSNDSDCPPVSTAPSAASTNPQHARPERNSSSENTRSYLLKVAAETAEKQLRDQAMAAYPNERIFEHVDHFAVGDEQDEYDGGSARDTPKARRANSRASRGDSDAGLTTAELQRHHKTLEQHSNMGTATKEQELDRRRSTKGPLQCPGCPAKGGQRQMSVIMQNHGGFKTEIEKMRNAASPPMAGEDLLFPICPSPKQTRLDAGNYPHAPKDGRAVTPREHTGLWAPSCGAKTSGSAHCGLWMGTSVGPALENPRNLQTGLLTPCGEHDDPFASSANSCDPTELPPSPPRSQRDSQSPGLNSVLLTEEEITLEFHDDFVTQVYNYLSLGYPSLAHRFDEELSKITRIPVEELRKGDHNTNAKGYIGVPEGAGRDTNIVDLQEGVCARWSALKKYVHEWAKQQWHMAARTDGQNGEWGHRAKRGSWAL